MNVWTLLYTPTNVRFSMNTATHCLHAIVPIRARIHTRATQWERVWEREPALRSNQMFIGWHSIFYNTTLLRLYWITKRELFPSLTFPDVWYARVHVYMGLVDQPREYYYKSTTYWFRTGWRFVEQTLQSIFRYNVCNDSNFYVFSLRDFSSLRDRWNRESTIFSSRCEQRSRRNDNLIRNLAGNEPAWKRNLLSRSGFSIDAIITRSRRLIHATGREIKSSSANLSIP